MRVQLWICDRCSLTWVADDPPNVCPACQRHYSGRTVIHLAAHDIEVASVRIYGDAAIKKAMKGTEKLRLGIRCPHGWVCDLMCTVCNSD